MRQVLIFLFLAGISFAPVYAQHTDSLRIKHAADSSILQPKDTSVHANIAKASADKNSTDTIPKKNDSHDKDSLKHSALNIPPLKDSVNKKKHSPRRATIYSTILPGAGQVYNRKYWKVPIVYVAIGLPAYAFFFNKSWYQKCQYALAVTVNNSQGDSLKKVDPSLLPFVTNKDVNGIITNRDSFRKNQDYSVLYFLLFYGLNIVDATVDAHLRDFNVNSDLSFKVKPMLIPGPYMIAGVSFVFDFHKGRPRPLNLN